jgi:putative DNA primase/helicase
MDHREENEDEEDFDPEEFERSNDIDIYTGKLIQPTDLGNAERMVQTAGSNFRYCHALNKFLVWDTKRWKIDDRGVIYRYAKDTIRNLYLLAGTDDNDKERKEVAAHAQKSESKYRIQAMIELAKHEYGIPITPNDLDKDHYLLNCLNGTVNLLTGELKPHDRDDFITKICPVEFYPKAKYPQWLDFLEQITEGDQDLQKFLQRCVGYSAAGDTSEQCWFLLYGSGANGKSTFLNTIALILNDYERSAPPETFLLRNGDTINNDIARLRGSRFVTSLEPEEGRRLNESLVKQLTGGDSVTARFLYGEFVEYVPTFKIWISSNHRPEVVGTSYATWRRIRTIPFLYQVPNSKRVRDLHLKLFEKEASGILNWIIEGFTRWQFEGLGEPRIVQDATEDYRSDMDVLKTFLQDFCIASDHNMIANLDFENITKFQMNEMKVPFVKATILYDTFMRETGEKISQKLFSRRLHERGYPTKHFRDGNFHIGIGLLDNDDFEEDGCEA